MYLVRIKTESDKKQALDYISRLPLDGKKSVFVGGWGPARSRAQNDAYWGVWLKEISDATGICAKAWHHFFKEAFLASEVFFVEDSLVEVYPTTTDLSKEAFSEYIEHIHKYAFETLGITLSDTGMHILEMRSGDKTRLNKQNKDTNKE